MEKLKGTYRYALILAKFTDIPELRISHDKFEMLLDNLNDYWKTISYNNININWSDVFGWFPMQYSYVDFIKRGHELDRTKLIPEAKKILKDNIPDVDLSLYHGFIVLVNGYTDGSSYGNGFVYTLPGTWGQDQWRYCTKCGLLIFAGGNQKPCAMDGAPHNLSGYNYCLGHDITDFPGQEGWRFCENCGVLVFDDNTSANYCHLGTIQNNHRHEISSSYHYALVYQPTVFDAMGNFYQKCPGQVGWQWCSKCGGLFWPGDPSTMPGRSSPNPAPSFCAVDGRDHSGSGFYVLTHKEDHEYAPDLYKFDLDFCAHEMGHTLGFPQEGMAAGLAGQPDKAYKDPLDIMSQQGWFESTTDFPDFWRVGPGMNAPNLFRAGWIPNDRVLNLMGSIGKETHYQRHEVPLAAVNYPDVSGYLIALVVIGDHTYTAELRHDSGWDRSLPQPQVFIHEIRNEDEPYSIGNGLVKGQQFKSDSVVFTIGDFTDGGKKVNLIIDLPYIKSHPRPRQIFAMVWTIIIGALMLIPGLGFVCIKCGDAINILIPIVSIVIGAIALESEFGFVGKLKNTIRGK